MQKGGKATRCSLQAGHSSPWRKGETGFLNFREFGPRLVAKRHTPANF